MKTELEFNFSTGAAGWVGDFADYPVGAEEFYELAWGWDPLPAGLGGHGIRLSGNNHSDDLFMFMRKQVTGLLPHSAYWVCYQMTIATNAPTGCIGVGGAPGESVYVKVGASTVQPIPLAGSKGNYQMNIDKGNQAKGGKNAVVVGDLANGETDCQSLVYRLKNYDNGKEPLKVATDKDGVLWLFVGTDSGFEATSTPYYSELTVELEPL